MPFTVTCLGKFSRRVAWDAQISTVTFLSNYQGRLTGMLFTVICPGKFSYKID